MRLKDMFYQDIERDIKGVIKIGQDDETNVYNELEEYVVTNELKRYFDDFFESYKKGIGNHTDKMGVWISGFFGSGKSHFLKILSYLLDNKKVNGKEAIKYFDDKIKDQMVLADMKLAADTNADVILFNIDSKSDSDSKSNKDAIVKVFMKVFNEMQGFCGSIPWLAELEHSMSKNGDYENFKNTFEALSGSTWEEAREDFFFEEDSIIEALTQTTKMSEDSARNWYEKSEESYFLSIEKFANRVKEYIESKEGDHHVVFLVDEIGQYIGNDIGLMLNLQTVVEDLGTYCGGKAWVMVTSQQDIDSIIKVKGNDFSKIQGRFNTRLNLSSANVDEVIEKRILRKNEIAGETLKLLYQRKKPIIKNLITFSSDTPEMKTYNSEEDFTRIYPFIPYQFKLLQLVFTGIRLHGASGKHLAEGERSLLGAFQEAALQYIDREEGTIVPFSAFYETIESFLDSNIRTVIIHAQDNTRLNKKDIEVLKLLFLIKYVREMPSNIENIATLLVRNIDDDKVEIKKELEESLKKLANESLIQKNGEEYIFLTDQEQDVNKEIQNIHVDVSEIIQRLGEEIFGGIYTEKRFRYNAIYNFDYNKIIDEKLIASQRGEIGIKILTPYFDIGVEMTDQELKMMSTREDNLILNLPSDATFLEEMEEILKIETYLRRKGGNKSTSEKEEIKIRKSREISERKERVSNLLIEAIKQADIYANSQKLNIKYKNPIERINDGFRTLINNKFDKINYIDTFIDGKKELNDILVEKEFQMNLTDEIPNKLAVEEVNRDISRKTDRNIPVSLKTIIEEYSKAPYGWRELDIQGVILRLFKSQEIKLKLGNEYLNTFDKDIIDYITKRDYKERLIIKKREKISPQYIRNVKELSKDLFNRSSTPDDEDGLMNGFIGLSKDELSDIKELLVEYKINNYPGKDILKSGKELFEEIINIKDSQVFYEKLYELKDDLLDYEEDVFDVKNFFKNQQTQFDAAFKQVNIFEKNRTYVIDNEAINLIGQIENIIKSREPYNQIHKLPGLIDEFVSKFTDLLEKECEPIKEVIENDKLMVLDDLKKYEFEDELKDKFIGKFSSLLNRLNSANNFYEAIAMKEESDRIKIRCFNEIDKKKQEEKSGTGGSDGGNGSSEEGKTSIYNTRKTITISITNILRGAKTIESKNDIETILDKVRKDLEEKLDEDTKIKLI